MRSLLQFSRFWKLAACLFISVFCFQPFALYSQCDPAAAEIPLNGIDEDCDGLDDVFLVLPPVAYAVVGQDLEVYFRNCILSQTPDKYVFEVNTPLGGFNSGKKWAFTPTIGQIGEHPFSLKIKSATGLELASASMKIRVSPASPPADLSAKKLWLYGHSFFDQGYMPKYLADLLAGPGNPPISFHGKKASWAAPFPKHEGYGGMMWRWFIHNPGSPFRYGSEFSLTKYFDEVVGQNQRPDWAVVHLDINDFCGYSALAGETLQEIDDSIQNDWAAHANRILDSIRLAAPNLKLAICLSPMPNARQSAFDSTYGGNPVLSNRWRWQKIISRLLFANIAKYQNRENEGIWIIPEYLDLDDFDEYNPPDARHPDPADGNVNTHCGYNEIAKSIYAWLKYIENLPVSPVLTDFWKDADGDSYGNPAIKQTAASQPPGYVANSLDCDDLNPNVHPGATEICGNSVDEDCNGMAAQDLEPPIIGCKNGLVLSLDLNGVASLPANDLLIFKNDNCGLGNSFASQTTFFCTDLGQKQVEITVFDESGNSSTCTAIVEIVDEIPPAITCNPEVKVPLDANGLAQLFIGPVLQNFSENCGIQSILVWPHDFSCTDLGQKNGLLTATDLAENASECPFLIKVVDEIPPVLNCKPTVEITLDQTGQASIQPADFLNSVSDNCGNWSLTASQTQFTVADLGEKTIILTAVDVSGNVSTCDVLLTVEELISTNSPADFGWKIGPNPTDEKLFIENSNHEISPVIFKIHDSTGRLVFEKTISGNAEILTTGWPTGFYQIEMKLENGLVLTEKLAVFH